MKRHRRIIDRTDGHHVGPRIARWAQLARDISDIISEVEARTLTVDDASLRIGDLCRREAVALGSMEVRP